MAERSRGPGRRRRRGYTALAAIALLAPTAACSGDDGGIPKINVYYAPEQNFQKVVDDCNQQAQGRYQIVYQVLPRGADDQRVQMVRRLAAEDDGMDVLGLDVTWTPEFASAEWILEWTGAATRTEVETGTLAGAAGVGDLPGQALRGAEEHQRPAAVVPHRPGARPAADLGRDDPDGPGAQAAGQALPGHHHGRAVRGPGRALQHPGRQRRRADPQRGRHRRPCSTRARCEALELLQQLRLGRASPTRRSPTPRRTTPGCSSRAAAARSSSTSRSSTPAMQEDAPDLRPRREVGAATRRSTRTRRARSPSAATTWRSAAYSQHPDEAFDAALCLRNAGAPAVLGGQRRRAADHRGGLRRSARWTRRTRCKDEILDAAARTRAVRPRTPAYQNVSTVLSATLSPPADIEPEQTADELRGAIQDALESKGVLP